MNKNIVLIGFMGSGKSTVGIELSYRLRRIVEDTDIRIEKKAGKSISDIFAGEGEMAFREMETALLKQMLDEKEAKIISVGGGTPVKEENRILLKQLGKVVYLRVQPETVYGRLKGDTTRPLLQGENPQEKIRVLLDARKEAYESCADWIIDVDELNVASVVNRIIDLYYR